MSEKGRAPGSSGPGEPGYDGEVMLGEEGAVPDRMPADADAKAGVEPETDVATGEGD